MVNLFKNYTDVGITLAGKTPALFYESSLGEHDDINRWVKADVSFEEVYDVYTSKLTKTKHYVRYGFRATVNLDIKIVNEDVLSATENLIKIINSDTSGNIFIRPNASKFETEGSGEYFMLANMKCISDISPQEISYSVRVGETLRLTFEGRRLISAIPILIRPTATNITIVDNIGDQLIDSLGNTISIGL